MKTDVIYQWMLGKFSPDGIIQGNLNDHRLYQCPDWDAPPRMEYSNQEAIDPAMAQVINAAIAAGDAELYDLGHVYAYIDSALGDQPVSLGTLRYDSDLGLHLDPASYDAQNPDY